MTDSDKPQSAQPGDRILAVVEQRVAALRARLSRSVSPVYADTGGREPEFVASSVLLQIGPAFFAVTAAHVLIKSRETPLYLGGAAQIIEFGGHYITTTQPGESTDEDRYDLAIMPLGEAQVSDLGECRFVQVHEIDSTEQTDYTPVTGTKYLLFGYPATKQRSMKDNTLLPVPMVVLLRAADAAVYSREGLSPKFHLALDFDKRRMVRGRVPVTAPDPHGASGGGVWRMVGLFGDAPFSAQLVAIPTEYTGRHRRGRSSARALGTSSTRFMTSSHTCAATFRVQPHNVTSQLTGGRWRRRLRRRILSIRPQLNSGVQVVEKADLGERRRSRSSVFQRDGRWPR